MSIIWNLMRKKRYIKWIVTSSIVELSWSERIANTKKKKRKTFGQHYKYNTSSLNYWRLPRDGFFFSQTENRKPKKRKTEIKNIQLQVYIDPTNIRES